jgi:peptide/nickel transport system substrate-binding protein
MRPPRQAFRVRYASYDRLGCLAILTLAFSLLVGCQTRRDPSTVVMLIEFSPANLDPRIGTDAQSEHIAELIFDSPLRRDIHSQLQPSVANRWESPDPLTYILHLRSDVKFHDGRALGSRDVKFTLDSLLSGKLNSLKSGSFSRVSSVEAPDEHTLVIRLKEPYASFLWNLTQGAFGIVPEGSGGDFGQHPIGSGPFRFQASAAEEYVTLERNANYWGGPPAIERVEFKVVPDATTRALELRNGSGDIALNALPADTVESLRRQPNLRITQSVGNTYQYIGLNVGGGKVPLPVRQALAYGIDRKSLIENLWRNLVRPADSVLPLEHWAHAPGLKSYEYDPAKAVELLESAGYAPDKEGCRLKLQMKTSTDQSGREMSAVVQEQVRHIGICLEARAYEFATFYSDISKGNFDLFSLRWIGGNEDPDIFEYIFHSKKVPPLGANRGRFSDPRVDHLIERARLASNNDERRQLYFELQRLLNEELPYIHLWYLDSVAVHQARLLLPEIGPNGSYSFLVAAKLQTDEQPD